jgi:TonB-linked SusC/RagA family outer membrane protein
MKKSVQLYFRVILLFLVFANILGFPSVGVCNGQGSPVKENVEGFIRLLEKQYDISITIDALAVKEDEGINDRIDKKSDEILKSKTAQEALDLFVKGSDFQVEKLRNDYYVIKTKKKTAIPLDEKIGDGDGKKVKGKVTAKRDGSTLPGVNVFAKGTTIGVVTGLDGGYEIQLPAGTNVLVFSFMGFKTVEIEVNDQTEINVDLNEDVFGLDEVIISGVAAETPRRNLSVSVTKLDAKIVQEAPASSAGTALQGKVAGLQVVKGNGLPGSGSAFRIRASTSLTGNQSPMIMLDGSIITTNLADINVDDIESYEIVKGAAAAALYGSKAGNGVIVITTKRGKGVGAGSTLVTVRQEIGTQQLVKQINLAEHHPYKLADDWGDFNYTRYAGIFYNDEGIPLSGNRVLNNGQNSFADQPYSQIYNNQDIFYTNGMYSTSYISLLGNANATNFSVSFERNRQEGILFETGGYVRNNLKFNIDHRLSDKVKFSTSNLFLNTESNNPGSNTTFSNLLFIGPDVDLKEDNKDGTPYKILPDPWSIAENPLYPLANRERTSKRMSLIGNVRGKWDIVHWMNLDILYTYEYRDKNWRTYTPKGYLAGNEQNSGGSLYRESYTAFDQNFQATLNFKKQFNDFTGKLRLSYLYENNAYTDFSVTGRDFIVADIPQLNNTDPLRASLNSYQGNIVAINYISILDMDYMDKYLFSLQYRMDGSSLFGEDARWHPFYRISGGYRITEDLMIPGIQELKIRAAYGGSGQRPGYNNQYETWDFSGGNITPGTMGNKNLKPSITKEMEVGLNMEFLKRFSFEFVYSNAVTEGAIAFAPIPSHIGYPFQWQNVGTLSGFTLESTLGMRIMGKKDFTWNANLIFDRIRQKVLDLTIPPYNTGPKSAFLIKEGETFGIIYGYKWLTSLEDMAQQLPVGATIDDYQLNSDGYVIPAGTEGTNNEIPVRLDKDNDGLADKVEIGDGNPEFNLSFSNTLKYKGFTFYFLLSWKNGGDIYNFTHQYTFRDLRALEFDQSGKAESEKKSINYYSTFYNNTEINSYFIEDGSFFKVRELSLYYLFTSKQLKSLTNGFVKSIRLGVQARNVLTFTKYSGYDPEVASGNDITNFPVDNFGYPNFRTITGSIQLKF